MATYGVLLRAVNVAGHHRLPAAVLGEALRGLGCRRARTYLQSGNAVVDGDPTDTRRLSADWRPPSRPRTAWLRMCLCARPRRWRRSRAHPLATPGVEGRVLHVTFLDRLPDAGRVLSLSAVTGPDRHVLRGREVYLFCPEGYGRTRLTNAHFERALGVEATTRNWNTATALARMALDGVVP